MPYGVIVTMSAPVGTYDVLHAELKRVASQAIRGLLVHIARPTADGFQLIEVWESKQDLDRYNQEVVWPLSARLFPDQSASDQQMDTEEFEVRGLVIPQGHIIL